MLMMEHHFYRYITKTTVAICLGLSAIFFACFTMILSHHVPDASETWRLIWGAYASASLTGVFFFALMMFSVLFAEGRENRRKKA